MGISKALTYRIALLLLLGIIVSLQATGPVYSATVKKPSPPPVDTRQFFDEQTDVDLTNCGKKFNEEPANTTVLYKDLVRKIQVKLSYNARWGSEKYKIKPYYYTAASPQDNQPAELAFGPLIASGEAMSCYIKWNLSFEPPRSAKGIMKGLVSQGKEDFYIQPRLRTINGLSVISYAGAGSLSGDSHVIVIGKKYNYHFSTLDDLENDFFPTMEKIIKTIKLVN